MILLKVNICNAHRDVYKVTFVNTYLIGFEDVTCDQYHFAVVNLIQLKLADAGTEISGENCVVFYWPALKNKDSDVMLVNDCHLHLLK